MWKGGGVGVDGGEGRVRERAGRHQEAAAEGARDLEAAFLPPLRTSSRSVGMRACTASGARGRPAPAPGGPAFATDCALDTAVAGRRGG